MITVHKSIYNLVCSEIYHEHHYLLKSKSYEFQNRNIDLLCGNDTNIAGYFVGIHRDVRTIKARLITVYSAEFNGMVRTSKLFKVVSYVHNNKA